MAESDSEADAVAVEWRLFADLAEAAGGDRAAMRLPPGSTVGDALEALLDREPGVRERAVEDGTLADHISLLRNGGRVDDLRTAVEPGDELALMPPVSGG